MRHRRTYLALHAFFHAALSRILALGVLAAAVGVLAAAVDRRASLGQKPRVPAEQPDEQVLKDLRMEGAAVKLAPPSGTWSVSCGQCRHRSAAVRSSSPLLGRSERRQNGKGDDRARERRHDEDENEDTDTEQEQVQQLQMQLQEEDREVRIGGGRRAATAPPHPPS